jgi:hypothetical protein
MGRLFPWPESVFADGADAGTKSRITSGWRRPTK